MLVMGLYPKPLIDRMEPSVEKMLAPVHLAQARLERERHDRELARRGAPVPVSKSRALTVAAK
jgi:hypothetical protein